MKLNRFVDLVPRQGRLAIAAATAIVATMGAGRAFAQGGAPAIPPTPSETQMGNVPPPPAPEAMPPVVAPAPEATPPPAVAPEATPPPVAAPEATTPPAAGPEAGPPVAAPAPEETPPLASPAPVVPPPVVGPPYPDRRSDILLPQPTTRWVPQSGMGLALMVGGGVTDFTDGPTRSATSTGGSWTARLAIATRSIVGFDASYVGGANTLQGFGARNATLVRNGLEGALRLNAPLYSHDTLFEPYALAGVGWNTYRVANFNSGTASVSSGSDNTVTIPLGLGFAVGYRGFIADIRYTLRPTYDQSIFVNETSSALSNWDLGGMLGYEF